MKLWSIYLKLFLTAILLLPANASYPQQRPAFQEILTGRARETLSADNLVQRGVDKIQLGNLTGAIADFNQALKVNPNDSQAYYYRGQAQRQLERSPSFREAYSEVLQFRGIARLQLGDEQGAVADLNYVLRNNPNATSAYLNRGLARLGLGQTQQAINDFTGALNLEPNLAIAYHHRGFAYHLLGNKERARADWDKAATLYREAYRERLKLQLDVEINPRPSTKGVAE